uniref:BPL/LPL catalytic domain-containing protein n=1 Tax=Parascaris univalens TaxID=6257 RepID=A0A915C1S3_PARUN
MPNSLSFSFSSLRFRQAEFADSPLSDMCNKLCNASVMLEISHNDTI